MERPAAAGEGREDRGAGGPCAFRYRGERAPSLPVHSRCGLCGSGDAGEGCRGHQGDTDSDLSAEGEALGSDEWDCGAGLPEPERPAPPQAGREQGPVVAADASCLIPEDIGAWRKLAKHLLILTAKDAEWTGPVETREDHAGAYRFFYSKKPAYAHYRTVWFGRVGIAVPPPESMDRIVGILARMSMGGNGRETGDAG